MKESFNFNAILPISEFGTLFAVSSFHIAHLFRKESEERDEDTYCR
jgi:hypothetical protein